MGVNTYTNGPATDGFYFPPEWSAHAGCWLAWPCRQAAHRGFLEAARRAYVAVAHAINEFEPVTVIVRPEDEETARILLSRQISLWPAKIDDAWLRDNGPTFLVNNQGDIAGVDWLFNAWGGKYQPFSSDDALAGQVLKYLSIRRYLAPLVMEGGSFHTDGHGTLLTTRQCLLHPNRNPRLSQSDIEALLSAYLGIHQVVWLQGDRRDDETDGHVDNIACFTESGQVLLMLDEQQADLSENLQCLRRTQDARGRDFSVTPLPCPQLFDNGIRQLASYINFYCANGGIVMPSFGLPEDDCARSIISEAFPGRRVLQIRANDIVRGGGGIHCITQQQPLATVA